ncbi:DUF1156 domain-containing protein [Propionibacterium australiense]|uniref:Uncharacterized protein n=1 Tax=Propionibacterium australiense TaxID=119981 RepID=A0A383S784_9ACTN|nr:DUF1156 domain-containing protein [Propionibacterium australiense]RLP09497.1 DUF1156 domain-containing protein [Propionibacterium australiense]SYZ33838.1 Protein of unknown function (DUF1156) [Propionibacterium australiense]VEH91994.1 Protein of uncharacterised function (DUF1156) [Propionibacterium australiense]
MTKKKLIETSLPLEAINAASAREKSIRHGHPSTLHLYWSRKPLATARAVLFAQLVDDPASRPEEFPTTAEQDAERARLHALMEKLVVWENSWDENLLRQAREEIRKSNDGRLPPVLDPFAGGGSIPLEAQRLGLEAHASDLNPLAVLINKALIEIPPKFAGMAPVNPDARDQSLYQRAEGLAEDVRYYGQWMRDEAERRIGHLYPKVTAPDSTEHTVIAWKWARTVRSPNPANPIEVPLVNSWWLSKKKGKEAWVRATVRGGQVHYEVMHDSTGPKNDGTINRKGAVSVTDGTPISFDHIRAEARNGRMGATLIAIVAEGPSGRLYISPTAEHVETADVIRPAGLSEAELPEQALGFRVQNYGLKRWADLFTNRQLVAMTALSDLITEARERVVDDALAKGLPAGDRLEAGGAGAQAYADAVAVYLALSVSRQANRLSSLNTWQSVGDKIAQVFTRQAISMIWDFAEANPFSGSSGNFLGQVEWVARVIELTPGSAIGNTIQVDASSRNYKGFVVSTDPPYYDNIGYSDLSDYFYVWLRRSLKDINPQIVGTMLTPKADELVANPYRHDGKKGAERFFIDGFNSVFARVRQGDNQAVPMTVYYAYKQQDAEADGSSSTGWHTLLDGLIKAGWEITATWPVRSERAGRVRDIGSNALASSIVLACRPRPVDAESTTRRAFVARLKSELPGALRTLMQGAIAPVDLAQAAIGPGISVFSRYARVREADGSDMSVKDALLLINATLDEVLGEQESDFDPDTRFAVRWYRSYGWATESSGMADQLARASDTSVGALERGGIFEAKGGKARLLPPAELQDAWNPASDERLSVWEATVRLAAVMDAQGADAVAQLLAEARDHVNLDAVKELGFLLFHEAEKKNQAKDALLFNGLVSAWGDVAEQARRIDPSARAAQAAFDFNEEED